MNGDGFDDIIVGAINGEEGESYFGAAYVLYGPLSGTIDVAESDAKLLGERQGDSAGSSVAGAGDVNGDGFDDVLVGAYLYDGGAFTSGAAYLLYGPLHGEMSLSQADARLVGEGYSHAAGAAVAGAGDVNGDGFDDVLIGTWNRAAEGEGVGYAYLLYGPLSGQFNLSQADVRFEAEADDGAGTAVVAAGDVNGDGFDDVLIGAAG